MQKFYLKNVEILIQFVRGGTLYILESSSGDFKV